MSLLKKVIDNLPNSDKETLKNEILELNSAEPEIEQLLESINSFDRNLNNNESSIKSVVLINRLIKNIKFDQKLLKVIEQ